ncbi:PipA/GogA/GtgA family type III secretion system effector [Pseudomonas quasicaspiana]|uniref:PipA/GogA/GtgA family type III secretion system effector n=1 Tax=Pseudomonas quasicaspiana TaxID=2829821 RepID=UPI001E5BE791|nr:PipA/GogA/GtgA family type III secretion system effector [Pseudomonas quasicaspiana]
MVAQFKNPSSLRKTHDNHAIDERGHLPLSQLRDYLLRQGALDTKGKSAEHRAALGALNETIMTAYQKSATFRRLFNQSWAIRLRNPSERCSVEIEGDLQSSPQPVLRLPDVLTRGSRPKYPAAHGLERASQERILLDQVVSQLTQLPEQEPGHPRGPNPEYVNIILKEMGKRDPAQIALPNQPAVIKNSAQDVSAKTSLKRLMLNIDSGASPSTTGKTFKDSARTHLNAFADRHLELIAQRPNRRQLTALVREETQASKQLPEILMRLFGQVRGDEKPMALLEKIAAQNHRQQLFAYRVDKQRSPLEMINSRDGDCTSFARLFSLLGEAAGITGLELFSMEGEMHVQLSSQSPEIAGAKPGSALMMARHTILQRGEGEQREYFDPVFGRQVNPAWYGIDQNRYLMHT